MPRSATGTLFCLASGAGSGAMAVFGKLAYDEGANVATLLASRFALAALLFWAIVAATGGLRAVRHLSRRDVALAIGLGAVGYAIQAGCFFAALERIDASLLSLLLFTFPAMVAVGAVALGRDRLDRRKVAALSLASAGLALVLAGAGTGALEPLGAGLGLAAALCYTTYILVSQGISGRVAPTLLSAIVCTGAATSLTVGSLALGQLQPGALTLAGWGWIGALVVISTIGAIGLFFAGLRRVGPTSAAILVTVEPVVTVGSAFLVFGERLGPLQLLGGLLVVSAVVALNAPGLRWRRPPAATPAPLPGT